MAVGAHAVREFAVRRGESPNDSTTITSFGDDADAAQETRRRGHQRLAITGGDHEDHRPDRKRLLFIPTVSTDGGVPVPFQAQSGTRVDDRARRATRDLLCQLTRRRDILDGADCTLAPVADGAHVHRRGGRSPTGLRRRRSEDRTFRESLAQGQVRRRPIHDKHDERGELVDRSRVSAEPAMSAEGDRLVGYHRTREAELDAPTRTRPVGRAPGEPAELRPKLAAPRPRPHRRSKVSEAVEAIVQARGVGGRIRTEIQERVQERYRQGRPGRPKARTR